MDPVKRVTILGATGSIGCSTVDLVQAHPERFAVQALTCHRNTAKLAEQAVLLKAKKAVVADLALYNDLKSRLAGTAIEVAAGPEAVRDAAAMPADWIMAAIVGFAGLQPLLAALAQGTCVAIANKEPLVAAGPFVMEAARRSGARIVPVDSEHNAIFQVFEDANRDAIRRLILTASGGPFRTWSLEAMRAATPAQAVAHPNWAMGAKISVDSASMVNKALEVIEAHYLFAMPPEKIDIVVHPQSLIHSFVEYEDGSLLAQMGAPDMRTPIAHSLAWPRRMETTGLRLDMMKAMTLDFQPFDGARFPSVPLAYECLRTGLWATLAYNAANEIAVAAFLEEKIGFTAIVDTIRSVLESVPATDLSGMEDVISFDSTVRQAASSHIMKAA